MTTANWEGPVGSGDRNDLPPMVKPFPQDASPEAAVDSTSDPDYEPPRPSKDPFDEIPDSRRTQRHQPIPPVPTVTYLADGSHHKEVQAALEKLLDAFGFDVNSRGPHVLGSVFQKTQFRLRKALTSDQITERLLKIERGIELQLVGKAQADVDALQGDAVAKLLTALKDEPTALIQIGSLLLIKADGVPVVRNLTQEELRYLERNPRLLEQPASILRRLAEASQPQPALPPANVS